MFKKHRWRHNLILLLSMLFWTLLSSLSNEMYCNFPRTCDFAWYEILKKIWICKSFSRERWQMVAGSTKETVINGFSPPSSRHSNFKKSFFFFSRGDLGMQLIIRKLLWDCYLRFWGSRLLFFSKRIDDILTLLQIIPSCLTPTPLLNLTHLTSMFHSSQRSKAHFT